MGKKLRKKVKNKWEKMLEQGTVFVSPQNGVLRRYLYAPNSKLEGYKNHKYAVVVWNANHPDDLVVPKKEVVHHKDGNTLNDSIENLQKLTRSDHMKIHSTGESNPFFGRVHSAESKQKMKESALRKFREGRGPAPSQLGVRRVLWDAQKAKKLREAGLGWTAIAKQVGAGHGNCIQQAFKRRGWL